MSQSLGRRVVSHAAVEESCFLLLLQFYRRLKPFEFRGTSTHQVGFILSKQSFLHDVYVQLETSELRLTRFPLMLVSNLFSPVRD